MPKRRATRHGRLTDAEHTFANLLPAPSDRRLDPTPINILAAQLSVLAFTIGISVPGVIVREE